MTGLRIKLINYRNCTLVVKKHDLLTIFSRTVFEEYFSLDTEVKPADVSVLCVYALKKKTGCISRLNMVMVLNLSVNHLNPIGKF